MRWRGASNELRYGRTETRHLIYNTGMNISRGFKILAKTYRLSSRDYGLGYFNWKWHALSINRIAWNLLLTETNFMRIHEKKAFQLVQVVVVWTKSTFYEKPKFRLIYIDVSFPRFIRTEQKKKKLKHSKLPDCEFCFEECN